MSEALLDQQIAMSPSVREALQQVGTPAYVYDLAEVRRNARRLRAALPGGSHLYYSLKANPHPTEEGVRDGLEGNLFRCTGHQNIVRAALRPAHSSATEEVSA